MPTPVSPRAARISHASGAIDAIADPAAISAVPTKPTRRAPNRSQSRPPGTETSASAIRNAVVKRPTTARSTSSSSESGRAAAPVQVKVQPSATDIASPAAQSRRVGPGAWAPSRTTGGG